MEGPAIPAGPWTPRRTLRVAHRHDRGRGPRPAAVRRRLPLTSAAPELVRGRLPTALRRGGLQPARSTSRQVLQPSSSGPPAWSATTTTGDNGATRRSSAASSRPTPWRRRRSRPAGRATPSPGGPGRRLGQTGPSRSGVAREAVGICSRQGRPRDRRDLRLTSQAAPALPGERIRRDCPQHTHHQAAGSRVAISRRTGGRTSRQSSWPAPLAPPPRPLPRTCPPRPIPDLAEHASRRTRCRRLQRPLRRQPRARRRRR